jgi:hypothetical protein
MFCFLHHGFLQIAFKLYRYIRYLPLSLAYHSLFPCIYVRTVSFVYAKEIYLSLDIC